jgi:hypothetical protein
LQECLVQISHGGSQGFKSPHLHPQTLQVRASSGPHRRRSRHPPGPPGATAGLPPQPHHGALGGVERLATRADAAVFTALPRSGRMRAAALLAEIGDCRARVPDAESLTCLAGAAPSTRRSGKHKKVVFRFACDKKLRAAVMDFAGDSRHDNPWTAHVYQQARARGHGHATPCASWPGLAPGDLALLAGPHPYDPARHGSYQRLIAQQA